MTLLSPDLSAQLLPVKSNTIINALAGRMAALITVLITTAFLLLFLLEVTAANLDKAETWCKTGLSSSVEDVNCS